MTKNKNKKNKNPSKEPTPAQQASGSKQQQQAHGSGQSQQEQLPTQEQQQRPLPVAGSGQAPIPLPSQSGLEKDGWKSSQDSEGWSQVVRTKKDRVKNNPSERGAKPKHQPQQKQHQQWPRNPQQPQQKEPSCSWQEPCAPREQPRFYPRPHQQQQQQWHPQQQQGGGQRQQPRDDRRPQQGEMLRAASSQPSQPQKPIVLGVDTKGKAGRPLGWIETNYLKLMMSNLTDNAYHYDVKFEPDKPKKLLTTVFLEFVRINFPTASIAFDGRNNAYASESLEIVDIQREISIIHPETLRQIAFKVTIMEVDNSLIPIKRLLTNYDNLSNEERQLLPRGMQVMEVILKSAFHQEHLRNGVVGGRSFFLPPEGDDRKYLGDFTELWLGLFQSMVLGQVPFLNVDVNHKAFPKRYASLVDMFQDMEQDLRLRDPIDPNRGLDRMVECALKQHLKGLDLCYEMPNNQRMIYKFDDIVTPPGQVRFTLENGQQTTVQQYFQSINRHINFPNLPCIKLGNPEKNIIVPMEFCSVPETQVMNKKCTDKQTTNIIKVAATSTDVRKDKILKLLEQIKHNQSPTIKGFGVDIDTDFADVPARQLFPPIIQYGKNRTLKPMNGAWRAENVEFLEPCTASKWGILNTNSDTQDFELVQFANKLYEVACGKGLRLAEEPTEPNKKILELDDIKNEIYRIGKEKKIEILFVVIPNGGPMYSSIKKAAELESGVLTQCIKANTIKYKRNDTSTISNILLKVNAKLNGTNHKLNSEVLKVLAKQKCMFIGADVTHPSPEQKYIPSVVGVITSFDDDAFGYYACRMYLQDPREEMIQNFNEIIKERLQFYKEKNGVLPSKIFYYRDGVSESQFNQVKNIEINAMIQACEQLEPKKRVLITVVIVQKRHHTRFFPGKTGVGEGDRNNNVPAGTIVDTVITRPNENHFYLVSHQSIQGVAKPTKYCVIRDDGNHSIDDLQGLTYDLCHLFARCNRTVSYPTPTYYAHLAAARGKEYIRNKKLDMDNLRRETEKIAVKENISKRHPKFFV